jgi:tetratricopeptide (TPR) repeat protein
VYKKLGLANNTDPEMTAKGLLKHSQGLEYSGLEVQLELSLRVNIEALALTKHFGLHEMHVMCLMQLGTTLQDLARFDEAEIFARDAVDFARDEIHNKMKEINAAGMLTCVLLQASKVQEAIDLCDGYFELYGTEDSVSMNMLRLYRSSALIALGRHEEVLAQLSYVHTSQCTRAPDWQRLSGAQHKMGRLSEAITSMEKAVELTRVDSSISAELKKRALAQMCASLAGLYQQGGRAKDARRLAREATSLRS